MTGQALRAGRWALPRWLHPGAWWAWALALAAAASRTTNPLLLVLIVAAAAAVVAARRPNAPWARSFAFFLRLGLLVIAVRVGIQVLFGASIGSTLLLPLPGVALPEWLAGVRLGGDVMLEGVLWALVDGLRMATILACVGAANSLASPSRLLKSVPAALYEVGVSIVVALTFTPQLVTDVARVQSSRRLRGRAATGPRAVAGAAMPVLESALERSVTLAAAMDSRGYGRRGPASPGQRRVTAALLGAGLVAACVGAYGLVTSGTPWLLTAPMLVAGTVTGVVAIWLAARGATRTRYRPDPWWLPEWLVALSGVACVAAFVATEAWRPLAMHTPTDPPTWPLLPLLPLLGIALGTTPALTAPLLPPALAARPAARSELQVAA